MYLLISKKKKTDVLAWAVKKSDFWGPILEGSWGSRPKKFWETKLRLQLNNFMQN